MKTILKIILIIGIIFSWPFFVLADSEDNHKSEIEKGRELVENKVSCDELSDEQLETMGEYLMEQMHPGESHKIMDQMMGGEGSDSLKQMHIQMTKRIYCKEDIGGGMGSGMMNMMQMMGSGMMAGASNPGAGNITNMMGWGSGMGWGWFGWIFMILFWVLIIMAIIALIKWLINQTTGEKKTKSALDMLKERYAKSEISKQEFEEKSREIIP